jgi:hypothetical protein
MTALERIYQKNPDIVAREIVGELVLVPIRRQLADLDSIFVLNDVASRIWELIDGQRSVGAIRAQILAEFDVVAAQAETDLQTFLDQCNELGAIEPVRQLA